MILVGTSGYNYPEWKGSFYPSDLPAAKMLPYYASKFPTVEINYTFYRMPTPKLIAGWRAQVPPEFRFTLEGAEAHHARQAAARGRSRRIGQRLHHRGIGARPADGRAAVSAAAELQEGPRTAEGVPRAAAAKDDGGVRVPQRVVARRRCVRRAARAQHRAVHRRQRDARDADRARRPTTPTSACATKAMAMPTSRKWTETAKTDSAPPRKTCSCISSMKTKAKGAAFGQQMMTLLGQTS